MIKRSGENKAPGSAAASTGGAGGEDNGNRNALHGPTTGTSGQPDVMSSSAAAVVAHAPLGHAPGVVAAPPRVAPQGKPSVATSGVLGIGASLTGVAQPSQSVPQGPGVAGVHGTGAGVRRGGKVGPVAAGGSSKPKGFSGDGKGAVIRMRGLPYRASKSEVMGFFKGCSIPEEGIAFVTRADGRVTGEAYVRFATREDAKMGIRKDREMMVSENCSTGIRPDCLASVWEAARVGVWGLCFVRCGVSRWYV